MILCIIVPWITKLANWQEKGYCLCQPRRFLRLCQTEIEARGKTGRSQSHDEEIRSSLPFREEVVFSCKKDRFRTIP